MKIAIKGYLAASQFLAEDPSGWDCTFIVDSDCMVQPGLEKLCARILVLRFDDIETAIRGKVLPCEDHIRKAIKFARSSQRLLVSCRAGQSRSSALAFLVYCHYFGPERAISILDPERHRPNALLIDLGSRVCDSPGLFPAISRWREQHGSKPLNYDAIEAEFSRLTALGVTDRISQSRDSR